MKRLIIFAAILAVLCGEASAQSTTRLCYGQPCIAVDATHPLPVSGPSGAPIVVDGNQTNGAAGVVTALNVPTMGYNYVSPDNGVTWAAATGLGTGTLATPNANYVSVQNADPCYAGNKLSAAINVTSGTTTSLVPVSGSTIVYVCGFAITIAPSAITAATALFEYGTGAACTSPTVLTGTFGNGDLTSAAGVAPILFGNGGATIFKSAASSGICILTAGNAVSVQGVLTYVQQ